jgi:hypothetical protein
MYHLTVDEHRTMSPRLTLFLLALLIGCGAPETRADTPPADAAKPSTAPPAAAAQAPAKPVEHDLSAQVAERADQELAPLVSMSWGAGDTLRIGYADAQLAQLDVAGKQGTLKRLEAEPSRVVYVSPDAKLALLDARPPRLVRVDDVREVLRMNHVPTQIEGAGWHPGGSAFFASEPTGKLHLWKVTEEQLRKLPDETIQMFLNRQLPDYTGHLPEMAGPFVVRPDGLIVFGDSEGHLLRWSPQKPTDVELIIKLDAPAASMTSQRGLIAATSRSGQLRVADMGKNAFVPWSMKASGQHVAAHEDGEVLFVARGGELRALRAADGALVWSAKLAAAPSCGLSLSRDGKTLAACFGERVLFLKAADGAYISMVGRHKDELRWR